MEDYYPSGQSFKVSKRTLLTLKFTCALGTFQWAASVRGVLSLAWVLKVGMHHVRYKLVTPQGEILGFEFPSDMGDHAEGAVHGQMDCLPYMLRGGFPLLG